MRYLLTSGGLSNTTIHDALVDLLGKPIAESSAVCIPTAGHALPGTAAAAYRGIHEWDAWGWQSFGVLELTAIPSIQEDHWLPQVQAADALLVSGGDPMYLCYWLRHSGVADLLPSLGREMVYVGLSAGSMVVTPTFGTRYDGWFCREAPRMPASTLPAADDRALGLVDFSVFPHLDHERFPENSLANAERWAAGIPVPTYAIDDQSALKVTDGTVEVVSEGHWRLFMP